MADPREDANACLEKHKVKKLFRDLGTALMYKRPADPNAYLLKVLEEIQATQQHFFTEDDVRACFTALDTTHTGYVTCQQYELALNSFGIETPKQPLPPDIKKVDRENFVSLVLAEFQHDAN